MRNPLGIVLVTLGLMGLTYGSFSYTTREKIIDFGPIQATRDQTHNLPLAPLAGAVAISGGVALLLTRAKS